MYIGLVILIIVILVLWAIMKNITQGSSNGIEDTIDNKKEKELDNNIIEMEEVFYQEVAKGEKIYYLMDILNQFDLMFVKSLFQSEEIPYLIESEHISKIRPGMQIGSFGNAGAYILEKDYDNAVKIIEKYKKNKRKNYKEKQTFRKPLEILFGNWSVPEADDIGGIIIRYKK
jgi:hypothetical protein